MVYSKFKKYAKRYNREKDSKTTRYTHAVMKRSPFTERDGFFKIRVPNTAGFQQEGTAFANSFAVNGDSVLAGSADFMSVAALYDEYEVLGFLMEWFPTAVVSSIYDQTTGGGSYGFFPMYICYDPDNNYLSTAPANASAFLQYENCKVYNVFKPFKFYVKRPVVAYDSSVNIAGAVTLFDRKRRVCMYDIAQAINYTTGRIYTRCEGLPVTASGNIYGSAVFTWYIRAHVRR